MVVVAGALGGRTSNAELASLLAERFTVLNYDRRGRGDSSDAFAYDVEREIEDLAAVLRAAGEPACVFGTSSGANLVLRAAAGGLPIARTALWEPNILVDGSRPRFPPTTRSACACSSLPAGARMRSISS